MAHSGDGLRAAPSIQGACFACGSRLAEHTCGGCRAVRFCGAACQRRAWLRHRPDCRAEGPPPARRAPQPAVVKGGRLLQPWRCRAYPNVGAFQGEVELSLEAGTDILGAQEVAARTVLGLGLEASSRDAQLFDAAGAPLRSMEDVVAAFDAVGGGIVAAAARAGVVPRPVAAAPGAAAAAPSPRRRHDAALVGGAVLRVDARRCGELPSLLRCSVPVVVESSGLLGEAPERWTFEYLERHMDDVDNFFVLRAPAASEGRFEYYDLKPEKNACGYHVPKTNERVEMRFGEFRRQCAEARRGRAAGRPGPSLYLQSALLHREEGEAGPPRPVGAFGSACAARVGGDIGAFRWDWLRTMMGGRQVQMCQLFCGQEGDFSPCHYDPQDNMFGQVRGHKRVLLFHPRHSRGLYPWPVHHPQDRQSRVNLERLDLEAFPNAAELCGRGLEAIVGPGDVLHIPPGWWHQVEMLPSPEGEVVSINFWYPAPKWFYGDPAQGEAGLSWDKPLWGTRRLLFQRCIEELAGQIGGPGRVQDVVRVAMGDADPVDLGLPQPVAEAVRSVRMFVAAVFPDSAERREMLSEVIDGRFAGLVPGSATA